MWVVLLAIATAGGSAVVNLGSNLVCPRSTSFPVCFPEAASHPKAFDIIELATGAVAASLTVEGECAHVPTALLRPGTSYSAHGTVFHVAEAPAGQWIGHSTAPVGQLRTEFVLQAGPVAEAWLYASGIGYSSYELNGAPVFADERLLDPAWTDYTRRVMFVAANVTALLAPGANCLGVWLGNGWFSQVGQI